MSDNGPPAFPVCLKDIINQYYHVNHKELLIAIGYIIDVKVWAKKFGEFRCTAIITKIRLNEVNLHFHFLLVLKLYQYT